MLLNLVEPKRDATEKMVLHYLAFYNQTHHKYKQPMKQFLNNEMENKNITDDELNVMEQSFKDAISMAKDRFREKCI